MVTSITSSGKSSISPESEAKVCDYFDDEIDDQPDLTFHENENSIKGKKLSTISHISSRFFFN